MIYLEKHTSQNIVYEFRGLQELLPFNYLYFMEEVARIFVGIAPLPFFLYWTSKVATLVYLLMFVLYYVYYGTPTIGYIKFHQSEL